MSPELEQQLIKKYPKIFSRCKDIECGDGWYTLLDVMCGKVQNFLDQNPACEQMVADQVKEKFATLRFYYSGGYTVTDAYISFAEDLSAYICEKCGNRGTARQGGWLTTLCEPCLKNCR
jgi:hypothetical protein